MHRLDSPHGMRCEETWDLLVRDDDGQGRELTWLRYHVFLTGC